jgi:glutathione S-transferase
MLTIWGRLNSRNVKKVAWFAEELGLSYVRHDVGMQFGMSDSYQAESEWLPGGDFGVGDVPMGVYAYTYFTLDIERPALPHVTAWYHRLQARDGYGSQVMIPLT